MGVVNHLLDPIPPKPPFPKVPKRGGLGDPATGGYHERSTGFDHTSARGASFSGVVEIEIQDVDRTRGLIKLPESPIDVTSLR